MAFLAPIEEHLPIECHCQDSDICSHRAKTCHCWTGHLRLAGQQYRWSVAGADADDSSGAGITRRRFMKMEETPVVATVEAIIVVLTVVVNLNLILPTLINPLVQKVGKIGAMETLLKILNMKVAEAEEKEVVPAKAILQISKFSNPFL